MSPPRGNRVDPFGDLFASRGRGLLTGNRGCLVDGDRQIVRHHAARAWICCEIDFRDWRQPLDQPRHWTPIFFLDEAVALAAGHRPCAFCRRGDFNAYRDAAAAATAAPPLRAPQLDAWLNEERLRPGRGRVRGDDRIRWAAEADTLPDGTVIARDSAAYLLVGEFQWRFGDNVWTDPRPRPSGTVEVLTPPTSVAALRGGFTPRLRMPPR